MRKLSIVTFLLCCIVVSAQQREWSKLQLDSIAKIEERQGFVIEIGSRIPIGSLADKIGISPELGFWVRSNINKDKILDFGFSAAMLSETKPFDYREDGINYKGKPLGAAGMVGFRLARVYDLGIDKYTSNFEWVTSFGYAFFMHETRYIPLGEQNLTGEKSEVRGFSAPHLGQGMRFTIDNLGLYASYNYTPYGYFSRHIDTNFGAHSLSVGIVYKP